MIAFDQIRQAQPPRELQAFARQLAQQVAGTCDKRERQRFQMATFVPAVVINDQLQPIGAPFLLMTRNISTGGIALVHTQPINQGRIAVELTGATGERIQLALEILWCRELDRLFELGCRYYQRLSSFSS